jgi:predicted O-methyltransferase YrrM
MAPGRNFKGDPKTAFYSCALQYELELSEFIDVLAKNDVRRYLEIGAKFGGTLWRVGNVLPAGSRIVGVDLPNGTSDWGVSSISLDACCENLREIGRDARLIFGNSADAGIVRAVSDLGPYDAILIDGDHFLAGLEEDWANYGPLGRIIAFHDIAWRNEPKERGYRIDVPAFWQRIKGAHRHIEISLDPTGRDNGIGILWQ